MRRRNPLSPEHARRGHVLLSLAGATTMWTSAMADVRHDFNDGGVPTEIHSSGGTRLSSSKRQSAEGKHALRWDWRSRAALDIDVTGPPLQLKEHSSVRLWLYNPKPIPGRGMELGAGKDGMVVSRAFVTMDFQGWRQLQVEFAEMQGAPADGATFLRLIPPTQEGTVFIDNLMVTDGRKRYQSSLARMAAIDDLEPIRDPSVLEGLRELKRRLDERHRPQGTLSSEQVEELLTRARAYEIKATDEGTVGKPIALGPFDALMKELALAWRTDGSPADKARIRGAFVELTKYMLDRGFAAGSMSNVKLWYRSQVHYEPFFLMQDALAGEEDLLDAVSASVRWANVSGRVLFDGGRDEWEGASTGYVNQAGQMDYLICDLWGHVYAMLTGRDQGKQAALLKAWGTWVERSLCTHHYDTRGQIKPDGCLYHHWMLYSGYGLPGITRLAEVVTLLDGTPFEVSTPVYDKLKFAYMRARLWAYPQFGVIAFGRHPLGRTWPLAGVQGLALSKPGTDAIDETLASVHARIAGLSAEDTRRIYGKLVQPEPEPEGYWSFNHAAAGILHRNGRAVHFKGFAKTDDYVVRGTEIYANRDNAFGRFQNYGTIEIFSYGDDSRSGFHYDGWDWRKYPGTTALLIPLDRMKGPRAPRVAAPFAGSCHLDNAQGVFAFSLDRRDTESLSVRKSAYAMENGVIVCLGSNIGSDCAEFDTITTLFQSGLRETSTPVHLGDEEITAFPLSRTLDTKQPLALEDASGNAYVLHPEASLHLQRTRQQSRHDKKKEEFKATEGDFATAWLSHGSAPDDAGYHYAIVPGGGEQLLQRLLTAEPGYRVHRQDRIAHIVEDLLTRSTACAAFEAGVLDHDLVYSVDKPCFVVLRRTVPAARSPIRVAVCDPNLNYRGKGPTTVTLTLKGAWRTALDTGVAQVASASSREPSRTDVKVTCNTGIPVSFTLQPR